jgi:hypothetical protein
MNNTVWRVFLACNNEDQEHLDDWLQISAENGDTAKEQTLVLFAK